MFKPCLVTFFLLILALYFISSLTIHVYKAKGKVKCRHCILNITTSEKVLQNNEHNFYRTLDERIEKMDADPIQVLPDYRTPCWNESLTVPDPYPLGTHLYIRFFSKNTKVRRSFQQTFEKSIAIFKNRLKTRSNKWRLRCLPFFYLIGINRGGSTSLWSSLISHPQLMGSGAAKELHYWDEVRYGAGLEEMGYGQYLALIRNDTIPRPIKSYVDLFDSVAETLRSTHVMDRNGRKFHPIGIGEGSPNYLTDFGNWKVLEANKGLSEPKYILAHILKMLTPRVKIVVILRDPIERCPSGTLVYFLTPIF
ncbi:hypothetical protein LSH36_152g00010 [Paralvinella palmiformis]|uniref:Uncharacterized protein n=1 Tax=Paralvinella palmiformis TaxID=53620 RepID=A0AAD9N7A5_9ANNE|nr:hypothetical protein LSH36_152g00010 [Paralvinella palmiformis]